MPHSTRGELDRRKFIQHASLATGIGLGTSLSTLAKIEAISIISDPKDKIASTAPVQWAITQLQAALTGRGTGPDPGKKWRQTSEYTDSPYPIQY